MTMPSLPAQGSTAWYSHYTALHNYAVATVVVPPATGTDTGAIDAAIAALPAGGGVLVFPAGQSYTTTGGHLLPVGTVLRAHGATITHTGNNVCFQFNQTGSFNLDKPTGATGLRLIGNAGTSAVGVEVGNCWGFHIDGQIGSYTAGRGLLFNNVTNWTEGVDIDNLKVDACAVGVQFRRTTGTFSFGYLRARHLSINVPASGIGIDIGGDSTTSVYLYNADIEANIWLNGNNAVAVRVGPNTATDNLRVNIVGEVPGGGSYTGLVGLKNTEGGTFKAFGHFNIKTAPNSITGSFTRILATGTPRADSMSGVSGADTFQAWLVANEDVSHNAMVGFIDGTNRSIPFVAGYAGNDAFRVYSMALNGHPSDSAPLFSVDGNGFVSIDQGTWNHGGLRLGNNTLWVDGTGKLRIKLAGYPTSDTDGVVVGTQT